MIPSLCLLTPLLAVPQTASPALLPEAPEDWAYERLDLPLAFAPDLPLEGYEELRFAPGMFTEGAPDYWSYVLALEVTGPGGAAVEVDAAWVRDFLHSYYRGLCVAVGQGKGLEIDRETIVATVTGGGASFEARIEMIDAFVTGEPLSLGLELLVHPDPGGGSKVQVLGLASPAAEDAPIWTELRAMGEAWRAARPVPVFLNHVYVVPDLETYAALRDSEFLREFAVFEERTTERGDMSYTGLYLYGEHTYFEFLKPDPAAGFAPGGTGVAFGVEVPGGLARMAEALKAEGVQSFAGKITRDLEGEQVPWFDILGIQAATTTQRLQLFAMEYDPGFLTTWHPRGGAGHGIDRKGVLARYSEVLGGPEEPLFGDITKVYFLCDDAETGRIEQVMRAFGYSETEGEPVFQGPGVAYSPGAGGKAPGGMVDFRVRLRHPVGEPVTHQIGQIRITIRDDQATFVFAGLTAELIK